MKSTENEVKKIKYFNQFVLKDNELSKAKLIAVYFIFIACYKYFMLVLKSNKSVQIFNTGDKIESYKRLT